MENKESYHVLTLMLLKQNLSGPEPITKYVLPSLGIQLPVVNYFSSGISTLDLVGWYNVRDIRNLQREDYTHQYFMGQGLPHAKKQLVWCFGETNL